MTPMQTKELEDKIVRLDRKIELIYDILEDIGWIDIEAVEFSRLSADEKKAVQGARDDLRLGKAVPVGTIN